MSYNNYQNKSALKSLPSEWLVKSFSDLIIDVSSGNVKLNTSDYLPVGEYPIIDQGKELIAGYTNNAEHLIKSEPPYIIFGDHTRIIKFYDKKFTLGADGVKVLKPKNETLDPYYFYYFLKSLDIPNTGYNRHYKFLKSAEIPVPPIQEQQQIVLSLAKADELIQKRKEAITKLNGLVESVFTEMFGDLSINDKKWEVSELQNVANISSGVTKGKKYNDTELVSIPYMRVANVQDGYLDLSDMKEISVSAADAIRYKLEDKDVLLTEGGDPDKLGRGAVWTSEISDCIHQNHIFRVRVNPKILNPYFLSSCTGSRYGKRYFLRMAKQTTGIATINMSQLKGFPVPLPPLDIQNKYESHLQQIDLQKQHMISQLAKLEENFQSLLHQAFTGRLKFRD